jgi:hypothetical protein
MGPAPIAHILGLGNWLIAKVGMSRLDSANDAIDLVAATVRALVGIVEDDIFGVKLVDRPPKMARSVAHLKSGYYSLPGVEAGNVRSLLRFTSRCSGVDPSAGKGTALNLMTDGAPR